MTKNVWKTRFRTAFFASILSQTIVLKQKTASLAQAFHTRLKKPGSLLAFVVSVKIQRKELR